MRGKWFEQLFENLRANRQNTFPSELLFLFCKLALPEISRTKARSMTTMRGNICKSAEIFAYRLSAVVGKCANFGLPSRCNWTRVGWPLIKKCTDFGPCDNDDEEVTTVIFQTRQELPDCEGKKLKTSNCAFRMLGSRRSGMVALLGDFFDNPVEKFAIDRRAGTTNGD